MARPHQAAVAQFERVEVAEQGHGRRDMTAEFGVRQVNDRQHLAATDAAGDRTGHPQAPIGQDDLDDPFGLGVLEDTLLVQRGRVLSQKVRNRVGLGLEHQLGRA